MDISENTRNIIVTGFGIAYLLGGIANFLYLRKNGFEGFASGAWLPLSRRLIQLVVLPNSKFFLYLLFTFQELVGIAILSRGPFLVYGLVAGGIFSLWAVFVDKPAMSITYFLLAVAQLFIVYTR